MAQYTNPYYTGIKFPKWGSQNVKGYGDSNAGPLDEPELFPKQSQEGSWMQNNQWAGQDTSGVGGIGAAVTSAIPNPNEGDRFSIDPYAGYKGSFKGLAAGGVVGAIVGGVGAQVGQFSKISKELKNLDTSVEGVQYDAYGRPVYGSGSVTGAFSTDSELSKGEKSLSNKNLFTDPANFAFSKAFGTKRKIRRKRNELQTNIRSAQGEFNTADANYRQQANQMEDYFERMNSNNRMYNVYRSQY
jgi:hypothetical protein